MTGGAMAFARSELWPLALAEASTETLLHHRSEFEVAVGDCSEMGFKFDKSRRCFCFGESPVCNEFVEPCRRVSEPFSG